GGIVMSEPSNAREQPPTVLDLPIGIAATGSRRETDSLGAVDVPADRYWGAQTQRSLHHFSIGDDRMPKAVIRGMAILKKAAALTKQDLGKLPAEEAKL